MRHLEVRVPSGLVAVVSILGLSFLAALAVTPFMRRLAVHFGIVAHPSTDRWHAHPTALLGGIAIAFGTAFGLLGPALFVGNAWDIGLERATAQPALGMVLSSMVMFVVGFADDVLKFRAQTKFLYQLLAGVMLVSFGALLPVTPWHVVNVLVTLFWFVALTNAFNLLDGLDGVAAGVGAIAAFFLGISFARRGALAHAALAWSLSGALLGFLRYNFSPASIFMGDAGSMFIGSVLAGLVVSLPSGSSTSLVSVVFVPLAIVAVPLLDTTLVTVTRLLAGRPIAHGGLDHSTYRLIALGLSERQVALLMYAFAGLGGIVSIFLTRLDRALGIVVGLAFFVAMSLLAAYLGRMQIAPAGEPPRRRGGAMTLLARNLVYKRRFGELLLDVVLMTVSYYAAYHLRFDGRVPADYIAAFQATIGVAIAFKIIAFGLFGVYRGAWSYAGILDLHRIVAGIVVATIGLRVYTGWRVPTLDGSHSVLYIDALLCGALILGSRLSFVTLEMVRNWFLRRGDRVLIYGAGNQGELSLRRLTSQPELGLRPVCFLDDDARKHRTEIHGVPIVGGLERLAYAVEHYGIKKIALGTSKLSPDRLATVRAFAEQLGIELVEVGFGVRLMPSRDQVFTRKPASGSP
jgi:UDP-GlcNAc:undecaprenyl-phosphate GlcNAc-1-phosphate transferase